MGGFFGVTSHTDCVADLFYGTDYHSHLGSYRGGMVTLDSSGFSRIIHDIANTQFRSKFEGDLTKLHGRQGLGVISDIDDQPLTIASHLGVYGLVTVGRIDNIEELTIRLLKRPCTHFTEIHGNEMNPTELVATLIDAEESFVAGIERVQELVEGSCSLLVLTAQGIYAARDKLGRTPVVIGTKPGTRALTLESCALPNLGFSVERNLGPGEIVLLTPEGIEQLKPPGEKMQICSFLWVSCGDPASSYENVNVEATRNRCGSSLARADDTEVDLVAGIPDSGIGHAIGYAAERGVGYRRPFVKYTPTWPQRFKPQEQRVRELVPRMKLIPIQELIAGNRLLFCEDAIVHGSQLRDIIRRLYSYGATQVHLRAACPPLLYCCKFLHLSHPCSELDLATRKALLELQGNATDFLEEYGNPASQRYTSMTRHIADQLELTSLQYLRLEDMIDAIGLPKAQLCTYCWSGESPG